MDPPQIMAAVDKHDFPYSADDMRTMLIGAISEASPAEIIAIFDKYEMPKATIADIIVVEVEDDSPSL